MLLRRFGTAVAMLYVLHRLLDRLTGGRVRIVPYALYAQPMGQGLFGNVRNDPGTLVDCVGSGDPLVHRFPRPHDVIQRRFASGAQCHAALVKGQFAGYIWICRESYIEDEVRCEYRLAEPLHAVWDFDVYVEPRYRLGRTMARLWKEVDGRLTNQGIAWSFSRISLFSRGSLGAHERLGAVRVAHAFFLVLGHVQCALLTTAPFVHVSVNRWSRPRLLLQAPRSTRQGGPSNGGKEAA